MTRRNFHVTQNSIQKSINDATKTQVVSYRFVGIERGSIRGLKVVSKLSQTFSENWKLRTENRLNDDALRPARLNQNIYRHFSESSNFYLQKFCSFRPRCPLGLVFMAHPVIDCAEARLRCRVFRCWRSHLRRILRTFTLIVVSKPSISSSTIRTSLKFPHNPSRL